MTLPMIAAQSSQVATCTKVISARPMLPQFYGSTGPKNMVRIAPQTYIKMNISKAMKPTLGMVCTNESIICLKAGTTVTILSTLMILKSRATNTLSTLLIGTSEIVTIRKSKIFQQFLKNLIRDRPEIILLRTSIKKNKVLA